MRNTDNKSNYKGLGLVFTLYKKKTDENNDIYICNML